MRTLLSILTLFFIALLIYCSGGEGGNHPVRPPGSMGGDTVKKDSAVVDSVR